MLNTQRLLDGKTVAITGGSGYIGSALINKLQKYNCKIIRTSRTTLVPIDGVQDKILDLKSKESWVELVSTADIIFHLAGNTSIAFAEENIDDSLLSNLLPITNLVYASKKLKLSPRVVYASTVTVYGLTNKFPVVESKKPNPITTYDLHKLFAEQELSIASQNNIINSIILRLANVYGPSLSESKAEDRGILNKLTRMRFEGKNIQIYGDGNNIRDYVYIDDVVSALLHTSIISDADDTYNVGSGIGSTIKDVFNLISSEVKECTGVSANVENVKWPKNYNKIDKRNYIASIEQLKTASDWSPKIFLAEGIQRLVRYYSIGKIND